MPRCIFVFCASMLIPFLADAAVIYLDPAEGSYGPGDTFILNVRLEPEETCVNAARVEIEYPRDQLRAVDFSRGGSILTLFVEGPTLDHASGRVSFSGGIPGGYCGRIAGDPVMSNILGKIIFTVLAGAQDAHVRIAQAQVYESNGAGTESPVMTQDAIITILPEATQSENPWIAVVEADTTPPEAFEVEVQSTRGVFDGDYYIVFSTVDKQSGMDHYELFERGTWKPVTSPYRPRDQSLQEAIQVKAIDKAGNERFGVYDASKAPERQSSPWSSFVLMAGLAIFVVGGAIELWRLRRRNAEPPV